MRGTPPKFQNSHTFAPLEFVGQLSIFPYVGYKHHVQQLTVLKNLGHTMYDPATIDAELAVQSGVNPIEPASRRVFRDLIWPCSGGSNMYQLFTSRGCTIPSHRLPQHSAAPIVRVACRGVEIIIFFSDTKNTDDGRKPFANNVRVHSVRSKILLAGTTKDERETVPNPKPWARVWQ